MTGAGEDSVRPACGGAIKARSPSVAAKLDETFAAQAGDVQKKLEASADSMLADVQKKRIDGRQYAEAVPKLKELADAFYGTPSSTKAKKMLSGWPRSAPRRC